MYLSSNTCPGIAFVVHKCVRSTHAPRQSHAKPVQHIIRYIKCTEYKGLIIEPSQNLQVDCCVDAEFMVSWVLNNIKIPLLSNHAPVSLLFLWYVPLLGSLSNNLKFPSAPQRQNILHCTSLCVS